MRRFTPEYLEDTRRGLWSDRTVLDPLSVQDRDCIVDVGCGTGELTHVVREENPTATVLGVDADLDLLAHVSDPVLVGDAHRLPFRDGAADLVVCQALLVNLSNPIEAVREFARVSTDLVALIEPDNSQVTVDSTVPIEAELAKRLRTAYLDGIHTDITIGNRLPDLLTDAGLEVVETTTHYHDQVVEPPYSDRDLESARQKAAGTQLQHARETLLAGDITEAEYDALLADWKAMGRTIIDQMNREDYRRAEVIPFHIAVGSV